MHCKELHLDNLKVDFFFAHNIPDFQIVVSSKYCPNKPYINGKNIYSDV